MDAKTILRTNVVEKGTDITQ